MIYGKHKCSIFLIQNVELSKDKDEHPVCLRINGHSFVAHSGLYDIEALYDALMFNINTNSTSRIIDLDDLLTLCRRK